MSTLRMFWFFLWRMALWGLGLGFGLGTTYGLFVGGLTFPYGIGFLVAGPLFGTIAGLALGTLGGLVLWAVALLFYRQGTFKYTHRYCQVAGWACAAACLIALALFLEITARRSGMSFVSGSSYDNGDVILLLIVFVGPSLVATGAIWWAGRKVAKKYAYEFGGNS